MPFGIDRPLPDSFEIAPIAKRKVNGKLFGPDNPPPRKEKGAVAKLTREIKNGITEAAANLGRVDLGGGGGLVGYLEYVGLYHPKAFCHLIGKAMPLQIASQHTGQSITSVRIIAVPHGKHLTREEIEQLNTPGDVIEDQPPEEVVERPAVIEAMPAAPALPDEEDISSLPMEERLRRFGCVRVV
jgi:hypothetical protein